MIDIFLRAGEHPIEFIFCILLALVPTVTWFLIFGQRHKCRWPYVLITLFAGMCAGGLVLSYQYFWGSQFDFIFFSLTPHNFQEALQSQVQSVLLGTLLVFLSIGFIEEYAKHWLVKMTDHKIFESIDDVIELSIIGALGFAMLENIGYFFYAGCSGGASQYHPVICDSLHIRGFCTHPLFWNLWVFLWTWIFCQATFRKARA
jgi:RsiW-degrading membrane proteinase PrsW (M82 family)